MQIMTVNGCNRKLSKAQIQSFRGKNTSNGKSCRAFAALIHPVNPKRVSLRFLRTATDACRA